MKRYKSLFEDTKESIADRIKKAQLEIEQQKLNLDNLDMSKDTASERKRSINDNIAIQKEIIKKNQEKLKNLKKEKE